MRKAFLIWLLGLFALLTTVPTTAQNNTIAQVIDRRSDLSTLSTFIDAAPEVRELLSSSGSYTVFAPNNQAFANLASFLEMPLQELLQSPQIVTQILQYHVISGEYRSSRVRQLNGQVVPTQLVGAFIGIRVNDNEIVLNNVVEVVETDISAGNGVIHVVNDVLLNRIIAAAMDSQRAEAAITPNPGADALATPEATATPTAEIAPNPAQIRFVHASSDMPEVDVYQDGEPIALGLSAGELSPFLSISPGEHTFSLVSDDETLYSFDITLGDGVVTLIALAGSLEAGTLQMDAVPLSLDPLGTDTSRLIFYHALEGAPGVDIRAGEETLAQGLVFGESARVDVGSGVYNLEIVDSGENDDILLALDPVNAAPGSYTLVIVSGVPGAPLVSVSAVQAEEAARLRAGLVQDAATPTEPAQQIIDVLLAEDDFTILIQALQAADRSVINRLASTIEPVTLLAPTDLAFENLFISAGITREQFMSNRSLVTDVLRYHIINERISFEDFRAANRTSIVTNLPENQAFFVSVDEAGTVLLNGIVEFEETNLEASNGIIHVIDEVLLPQSALRILDL